MGHLRSVPAGRLVTAYALSALLALCVIAAPVGLVLVLLEGGYRLRKLHHKRCAVVRRATDRPEDSSWR